MAEPNASTVDLLIIIGDQQVQIRQQLAEIARLKAQITSTT